MIAYTDKNLVPQALSAASTSSMTSNSEVSSSGNDENGHGTRKLLTAVSNAVVRPFQRLPGRQTIASESESENSKDQFSKTVDIH